MVVNKHFSELSDFHSVVGVNDFCFPVHNFVKRHYILGPNDLEGWLCALVSSFATLSLKFREEKHEKLQASTLYRAMQEEVFGSHLSYFDRGMKGTAWAAINGKQLFAIPLILAFVMAGIVEEDDFFVDFLTSTNEKIKNRSLFEVNPHISGNIPIRWQYDSMYRHVLDWLEKQLEQESKQDNECNLDKLQQP